ncbi:hypothetical protein SAMN04488040_1754 [Sulfitobacter marinus]|uniref:DUF1453 domain-containing protein n=1 Tax=Sulfitobacter marinus TaxID=394264 RepID=A0A1I6S6L5_9RHOB|nr:hypothetical protein [Sulfitobacter marinus]SFS72418.1 hypothetical protein SAMN04488040_1754 [Sulfitobacter marinus]
MTRLITDAPLWVWPLFTVLLLVGLRARRDREVPVLLIYALPLLSLLSLHSIYVTGPTGWIWVLFIAASVVGAVAGHRMQERWVLARTGRTVYLAGESVTLLVIMTLYWSNFAGGALRDLAPDLYANAGFHAALSLVLGLFSGSFLGRALRVWRMA